jgi:DNA modification methylase
MEEFINKIICGDCIEEMKKLPDNSIDCIITDPPYNWSHKNKIDRIAFKKGSIKRRKSVDMNFGEWDYQSEKELEEFTEKWILESMRILKPTGSIYVFYSKEEIIFLKRAIEKFGGYWKSEIIWHKTNPTPNFRKRSYISSIEAIGFAVKNKGEFTFNFKTQKEMHNFLESGICQGKERTKHPTQKPLWIVKHFIEVSSNKGDIILDCFAGSGTTAIACLKTNRKFIGIEKESDYVKIAEARIKPYLEQRKL